MLREGCQGTATSLSNSEVLQDAEDKNLLSAGFFKNSFVFQLTKGAGALVWPHIEDAT